MTNKSALYRYLYSLGLLIVAALFYSAQAQPHPEPARERLLNGLTVFYWQRPGEADVFLKLRLHSGAAFDLAGKSGTMALLGDALFPDPATREYVTEQLGGRLEVSTNYDALEVIISGKAAELERLVELLRNAIINLNLSADNVAKLRETRIAQLTKQPDTASQVADRAIASRLFGSFPYAHPVEGTAETVLKIERADLMLARDRFLHSDNAALVVMGGVDKGRLMRTLRQLLGPWQKADSTVAATFRQPDRPGEGVLLINQAGLKNVEVRLAVRGLARSDRDAIAASLLAHVARERWQAAVPNLSSVRVQNQAFALPGIFTFAASAPTESAAKAIAGAQDVMRGLVQNGVSPAEFERARTALLAETAKRAAEPYAVGDTWLDSETYKISSAANSENEINRVTATDIQRAATRIFKDAGQAKVVVGDSDQLKAAFGSNLTPPKP